MTTDVREAHLPNSTRAQPLRDRQRTAGDAQSKTYKGFPHGCPRHKPTRSMPTFLSFEES